MKTFVETVQGYRTWKLQEKGSSKITKEELASLREEYNKGVKNQKMPKQLQEACKQLLEWKTKNGKGNKITTRELNSLKESLTKTNRENLKKYMTKYVTLKEASGFGNELTKEEAFALKENFKKALRENTLPPELKENTVPGQAPTAPAPGDPNAVADPNMMDPTMGDPNAMAPTQDPMALQNAVDTAIAALQPVSTTGANPLAADPNAGIPPVDGTAQPQMDTQGLFEAASQFIKWKKENGKGDKLTEAEKKILKAKFTKAPAKPLSESEKIMQRIVEREQKLAAIQESALQDDQKKKDKAQGLADMHLTPQKGNTDYSAEQVVVPPANKLANGFINGPSKAAAPGATWPTKDIPKSAKGALQGEGATNTKLKETTTPMTVTDIYIQKSLEPKLDFEAIRESMKNGLLG